MTTELRTLVWSELARAERNQALARPPSSRDVELLNATQNIVDAVRRDGDAALAKFTQRFDGVTPTALRVPTSDLEAAWHRCPGEQRDALTQAVQNIERFHRAQRTQLPDVEVQQGVRCRQIERPIDAVGLYVPGGSAPLPSALLMLAIPATLTGCPRIAVCSPPQDDGRVADGILAAAYLCGVRDVFAVGGAQAIAALAYGTSTIQAVDKIFGPGNAYVTAAKMLAAQDPEGAACDMPAGPSEVLVIADQSAHPAAVAADLLAQAEHGPDSQVLLFTDSSALAQSVTQTAAEQTRARSRAPIIDEALSHSRIVVFATIDEAVAASNQYAPEHLIINTLDADARVDQITNAGSIFVGPWAAETFGDYCSGTNHVLPTYGFARAYSGVTLNDFSKRISVQHINGTGFDALADTARTLARMEGLDAHEAAVSVRQALRRESAA